MWFWTEEVVVEIIGFKLVLIGINVFFEHKTQQYIEKGIVFIYVFEGQV